MPFAEGRREKLFTSITISTSSSNIFYHCTWTVALFHLNVVEYRGNVSRRGPIVRLGGQNPGIPEAVVDSSEGLNAVRGSSHVRHGGAVHVLHLQVRAGAV